MKKAGKPMKKAKTQKRAGGKTVVSRSFLPTHKPYSIGALILCAVLFGIIGFQVLLQSRAATPVAFGSQFHCIWASYSDAQRTALLDKLAAAKVSAVRIDMGWDGFEQSKGTYDGWYTQRADFCVNEANKRGIKVLVTLHQTPGWANNNAGKNVPPNDPNDFANFAQWAATHFKGRVMGWEVWNEPNLNEFWTGTVNQYVQLLQASYPRFKAGDPVAKVVFGGTSYNDDGWLSQAYAAGAKGSFDVMSTHPYQGKADEPPEKTDDGHRWWFTHFPAVINVMNQYGDGAREVWFTEFGWSSHANTSTLSSWQLGVTEQQQADYLTRAIKYTEANYPNVTQVFWYNERNRTDADIQNNNYGLLYSDLTEKPAYIAIKDFLANRLSADTTAPTVALTNPAGGTTVTGIVTLSASASDNVSVSRVDFYANNNLVGSSSAAPYSFAWDTSKYPNGSYTLSAAAYDPSGNKGTSAAVGVSVNNAVANPDTSPPAITITTPADGIKIGNKLTVNASATDNTTVTKIEAYLDSQLIGSSTGSALSATKNTRRLSSGTHLITIRAYDSAGNTSSKSVSVYK